MTILDQNGHWSKSGRLTSGFGVVLDPNMAIFGPIFGSYFGPPYLRWSHGFFGVLAYFGSFLGPKRDPK